MDLILVITSIFILSYTFIGETMLKNKRLLIFIIISFLILIGLMMIYSSSFIWAEYKFGNSFKYLFQQLLFVIIGYIILYIILKLDSNIFYKYSKVFLLIAIVLLILVLIPGIGVIRNGSRSWFGIGPFGIQPSELMKIVLIIYSAKVLSNIKKVDTLKSVLKVLLIVFLVFFLIMLEPDFGTGLIIVMSVFILLFIAGLNIKYFYRFGILGIIGIVFLILIAPYRMDRITSFLNPWKDPLGTGFQIIQSLYAIGPGGMFGTGYLGSRQKYFYLPEPQTDFIFSIICEEFGIFGALVVIALFTILIISIFKLAIENDNLFKKYTIFGLGISIAFQTILNLSVVVGLIPVTGVTLPFISYGGSSLLVTMTSIGIILNLSKNNN